MYEEMPEGMVIECLRSDCSLMVDLIQSAFYSFALLLLKSFTVNMCYLYFWKTLPNLGP